MEKEMLGLMLGMAEAGGRLAQEMIEKSEPVLKPDQSVLTRTDPAVSRLVRESLKELLRSGEHILVDEEDPQQSGLFENVMAGTARYVWAVDPIDGTRAYANQMPVYGVSLGVLRDLKPWLGVVYFPALRELFYSDGTGAFFVQKAFTQNETRRPLRTLDQEISACSIFLASDRFMRRYEWEPPLCQVLMPTVAVVELCWPAIGRGCGGYFEANLWDFAGSWPVFRAAGLELRSVQDGTVLDRAAPEFFSAQGASSWHLKEDYILSSARNYDIIKSSMKPRR